ncbi:MAG: hypothetical protein RI922_1452 [Bacteroidota bacterium]|jgi:hypothetical protein
MKMKSALFVLLSLVAFSSKAQLIKWHKHDTTDITFSGTKINPYDVEYDTSGKVTLSGYVDTYYSYYTDSSSANGFSKFPTIAPRNNQVGINMLQLSAKYESSQFRGTVTLFGGDCPQASWSNHLNFIQEANAGFRVVKKLWLDAGFFRTHIGLESIQPRENMTMSLATTTYFEPYFLSGLKLTWQQSKKLAIQLNAFNSFNQFLETNKNKAVGFSIAYVPTNKISATFSSIYCDESPDTMKVKHQRVYNNLCLTYKSSHWILGLESNLGIQANSVLTDPTKTAFMFSALLAAKYRLTPKWALYGRTEVFEDPNELLTGPVINSDHQLVGIDLVGGTLGFEFKPIPNSYFRIESRLLHTTANEKIFYFNNNYQNQRMEFIVGLGFWF